MFSSFLESRTRREIMQLAAAGAFVPSLSGWMKVLANRAAEPKSKGKHKSCILIWLDGGPSQKDTFDLKPGSKGAGEFHPISTSASGIQISEHLPKLAKVMNRGALVRGMSTPEGAHGRAKYYAHTGYREGQGGLTYPSLGSIAAMEIGNPEASVPNFVSIGNRSYGAGFLGPKHQPLMVQNPDKGVEDLKALVNEGQFSRRVGLLQEMESAFHREQKTDLVIDHKTNYERAVKLMQSKEAKAFDLAAEPSKVRSNYGGGTFGDGCLMARRLVEVGVPFVEVSLGGWDTHQDNFERVKTLSGKLDAGAASLVSDLQERGLLDSTLVVIMGEFGRTPSMNTRGNKPGRDHYPRAWSLAMFGGGIAGGRIVGKTDADGVDVVDGKTSAQDFLATVCELIGIDYTKKNEAANGRPITIVEKANPFTKLLKS
ncbi:MAG: DUF1501 domain-containing protein [Gemmataceae bacterium]